MARPKGHRPPAIDPHRAQIVEDVHVEWFEHLAGAPGVEVHSEPDIAWQVTPGSAWSNCAVRVRLPAEGAKARLEKILKRYRANGRGAGFWVGPATTPLDVEILLKSFGLRCRRYFPAMYCDLERELPEVRSKVALQFAPIENYDMFSASPHPGVGPATTTIRRLQLAKKSHLALRTPRKSWELAASIEGRMAGVCTLFVGERYAGLFDVSVLESFRGQGMGRSLVRYACAFAQERSAKGAILIAASAAQGVYRHAGFEEVASFGFWYTAHP